MIRIENKRNYSGPGEYVGRPSLLGNHFIMRSEGQRDSVIDQYHFWLHNEIGLGNPAILAELTRLLHLYLKHGELVLICWCSPKRCHASVIADEIERMAISAKRFT